MSKIIRFKWVIIAVLTIAIGLFAGYTYASNQNLEDTPLPGFNVLTDFVNSNRYTQQDSNEPANNQQPLHTEDRLLETGLGPVYVNEEVLSFQFQNDRGYIWSSTVDYNYKYPDDSDEKKYNLIGTWKDTVRSAVIIHSYNISGTTQALTDENLFTAGTTKNTVFNADGFESRITFGKSKITLTLKVSFTATGVEVEIPGSSIQENGSFRIASLDVYPFFGAVLVDHIPGYVFIPDGIGALIRYKKEDATITGSYQKEIYGRSLGYNTEADLNDFSENGARIYAPVFGFVHGINQNAVFANIESGAEYGMLNVYYPGKPVYYTTVFPQFVYRRYFNQPIDKTGGTILVLQEQRNNVNVRISYSFLDGEDANYVGMAKKYRSQLDLAEKASRLSMVPLKLDTIGLEKTTGVLFDKTIRMTTFAQFDAIVKELSDAGVSNIVGTFAGFTPDGTSWAAPDYRKISSKVGTAKELADLKNRLSKLYLVTEYQKASSESGRYNRYFDLAKKINQQLYQYDSRTDSKYLLEYSKTASLFKESSASLKDYGVDGLAITSMGSLLYGDYGNSRYLEDAIKTYQDLLDASDMSVALYGVNNYLWGNIDAFFDFPMYSSQYLPFDDTVPFMSIVLRGKLDLFGANANFYPYARDELLRLIDFGVYPSFMVTSESSKLLQETELEYLYSTRFADLMPEIITYYHFVNQALSNVMGAGITGRQILPNQLVAISYDNGTTIVVNYANQARTYNQFEVMPKNYLVIRNNELLAGNFQGGDAS